VDLVLSPFRALWQGFLRLIGRGGAPETQESPAVDYSKHQPLPVPKTPAEFAQRYQELADRIVVIHLTHDYMTKEPNLPTSTDPEFTQKLGEFLMDKYNAVKDGPRKEDPPNADSYREAFKDFNAPDPVARAHATQFLVRNFLANGLGKVYPEFFTTNKLKPEYDKFLLYEFTVESPTEDVFILKGFWVKSPLYYQKKLVNVLDDPQKGKLKDLIKDDDWEKLIALAAFNASHFDSKRVVAENLQFTLPDQPEYTAEMAGEINQSLKNYLSVNTDTCFEGAQYFANDVKNRLGQYKEWLKEAERIGYFSPEA
jgi:hypothetical protein